MNWLLASLPHDVLERMAPHLEAVRLDTGRVLRDCHEPLQYAYFPIDCTVSLRCALQEGSAAEVAVVGNEGMIGISVLMGGQTTTNQAILCSGGTALRIRACHLTREFELGGPFQRCLLLYMQSRIVQTGQLAACNRHHTLIQRLCRWLLQRQDRLALNVLPTTQEHIGLMLGVRREGVTEATGRLQSEGMIRCSRGRIAVLNRPKVEALTCECYAVVKREYHRLLPPLGVN